MTDLEALAARVEGAKGPDRELDADIGVLVGGFYLAEPRYPGATRMYGYVDSEGCRVEPGNGSADRLIPAYTASLDAAMTLVPEGHTVQLSDWDHAILREKGPWQAIILPMGARGAMQQFTFTNRCDHAATPALALTAAALRARAHLTTGATHDR